MCTRNLARKAACEGRVLKVLWKPACLPGRKIDCCRIGRRSGADFIRPPPLFHRRRHLRKLSLCAGHLPSHVKNKASGGIRILRDMETFYPAWGLPFGHHLRNPASFEVPLCDASSEKASGFTADAFVNFNAGQQSGKFTVLFPPTFPREPHRSLWGYSNRLPPPVWESCSTPKRWISGSEGSCIPFCPFSKTGVSNG